jgi:hypothetical protein
MIINNKLGIHVLPMEMQYSFNKLHMDIKMVIHVKITTSLCTAPASDNIKIEDLFVHITSYRYTMPTVSISNMGKV